MKGKWSGKKTSASKLCMLKQIHVHRFSSTWKKTGGEATAPKGGELLLVAVQNVKSVPFQALHFHSDELLIQYSIIFFFLLLI